MTQDEIICMARKAGFLTIRHLSGRHDISGHSVARFERFAALIADVEREACAKACDEYDDDSGTGETWGPRFATMIRARSKE